MILEKTYPFPGHADDLPTSSYWYWGQKEHPSEGLQSFGYDLTGIRFDETNKKWTDLKPGFDSYDTNQAAVIYGTPVYAIADGEIFRCWRNAPENPRPRERHPEHLRMPGGGNELYVRLDNGDAILYAHFQTGTIPKSLCPIEKALFEKENHRSEADLPPGNRPRVKKGQFIGRVGNAGHSSGPHLHIHMQSKDNKPVALPFHGVWTKSINVQRDALEDWVQLEDKPLPSGPIAILPGYPDGFPEVARHGVPANIYKFAFEGISGSGYRPIWVDGYEANGSTYFNMIFRPEDGVLWAAKHGLTSSEYQAEFDKRKSQGYRPFQVESYLSENKILYDVIFIKKSGPAWSAYHGKTVDEHQNKFNSLTAEGFCPVNVSVVSIGGQRSYTALYEKIDVGSFVLKSFLTASEYQNEFDQNKAAGRQLTYLNAYNHNGSVRFSAIWNSAAKGLYVARHGLNSSQYQAEWEQLREKGYLTQVVTGYEVDNNHRFAGLWRK